jgi:hypothetical protein
MLDALARTLVSEPTGQEYAVGAQVVLPRLLVPGGMVRLHISTNGDVPSDTVKYVADIWASLQRISRSVRHERIQRAKERARNETSTAEKMCPGLLPDVADLVGSAHRHCFHKWRKWLTKRYQEILEVMRRFVAEILPTLDKHSPVSSYFPEMLVWVVEFHGKIEEYERDGKNPASAMEGETFVRDIMRFSSASIELEAKGWKEIDGYYENHGMELAVPGQAVETNNASLAKPVSRYFKKLAVVQRGLYQLLAITRDPKLFRLLQSATFVVIPVHGRTHAVALPKSLDGWNKVVRTALEETNTAWIEGSEEIGKKAAKTSLPSRSAVHGESNILQYFATKKLKPRPNSYIGHSKLSCAGCAAVFRAWNVMNRRRQFFCCGSHGNFHYPWAMPRELSSDPQMEADIVAMTYKDIAASVSASWLGQCRTGRWLSDSSVRRVSSAEEDTAILGESDEDRSSKRRRLR